MNMNNLLALCGMVLISSAATPNNLKNEFYSSIQEQLNLQELTVVNADEATHHPLAEEGCKKCKTLNLDEVVFLEEESPFDLGFDTADYLPEGFDPYKVYVNLDAIQYIADEDDDLGFDTTAWLPEGFNAYAAPEDFTSVSYIEAEEGLDPAVDTKAYLPEGFDPYKAVGTSDKGFSREHETK